MALNKPAKVIVGILTVAIALLPVGLVIVWLLMVFGMMNGQPRDFPFQALDPLFAIAFPLVCSINVLIYGMMAFYVAHAVKNAAASDVVRIAGILLVFFFPYLGMPAYYIVYIVMPKPPAWAMKPQLVLPPAA